MDPVSSAGELLLALPTELWYCVLSFLDPNDKMLFAQCSWHCFSIAFPNGVKIPDVDYEWSLRPFSDGGRLAELKHRIHSARFDIADISNLYSYFEKATIFPNLHRLEINIIGSNAFQKEILAEMLLLLSTLPYYENLSHLVISWHNTYRILASFEANKIVRDPRSKITSLSIANLESIVLPQSLRSLTLFIPRLEHILPLVNFERITNLVLLSPIFPPDYIFYNIKKLTIDSSYPIIALQLPRLTRNFPSVETFSFLRTRPGASGADWIQNIPIFPKMKTLSTYWPQVGHKNADIDMLETALQTKFSTSNDFPVLRSIIFCGYRDFADHRRNITATCVILRTGSRKPGEEFEFKWHGNLGNYQDDPSFADSLLDDSSDEEWEEGNTDEDESEFGEEDDVGIEEEDQEQEGEEEYDSEYFEYLASDDEFYDK
ncbi:hypothetical protein TWF225_002216 [Orbilia oligospora]|uniref:F-box domain-containing protein n=1 Tax=Orbilia oligospora TaxID=2813651 RepID=A0A7C8PQR7_ORBOL|nr:hypothetical protein TWF751_005662 [Orbilia oligospora]KAF3190462.1 hypothetical protein TWF225_002216 [Orbilia oligospora]KAF3234161.1 hypothetical protein TWF217_004222 [Orbilia oligospora]KAF3257920.1 hypothetical protein TWF128_004832 [Orbilia oligospora]KAF3289239.1 hypothetical protein TWF132_007679 [Orbilia oligospora]